jgi:hypothetical protein
MHSNLLGLLRRELPHRESHAYSPRGVWGRDLSSLLGTCTLQSLSTSKEGSDSRDQCKDRRRHEGKSDSAVVNQTGCHLHVRGKIIDSRDRVTDLINHLEKFEILVSNASGIKHNRVAKE